MRRGADAITSLRIIGRENEFPLLAGQDIFSLGSSTSCDVCVENPHVSGLHCSMVRKGQRLRIVDQHTKNGTYFGDRLEQTFDIGPGDMFTAASTTFVALNEDMRTARPAMLEVLGRDRRADVDELLSSSVRGHNLLLIGEEGCEQGRLARAIHHASPRARSALVELSEFPSERAAQRAILDSAQNGALLLSLKAKTPLPDDAFRSMLLSSDFRIRLYVAVPSRTVAEQSFGHETVSRMIPVHLRPLRERAGDVPWLLDRILNERQAKLRTADLRPINQEALQNYSWPQNVSELRDAANRLIQLTTHDAVTKAAEALDMPRTTLLYWLEDKLHMELPLIEKDPRS